MLEFLISQYDVSDNKLTDVYISMFSKSILFMLACVGKSILFIIVHSTSQYSDTLVNAYVRIFNKSIWC